MEGKTNLRALRHRYKIPLSELSMASDLSIQYISRAELGEISPTVRLEDKLGAAVETGRSCPGWRPPVLWRRWATAGSISS